MLGADHVIATRMVVEDGKYTGEIEYYAYGETKAEAIRELAEQRRATTSPRCYAYSDSVDRPADARGRRPPVRRQPRPGAAQGGRRSATGRCWCSPGRCGCATGSPASACGSRPRWPRSRWVPAQPPPESVWLAARRRGAATAAAAACRSRDTPVPPSAVGNIGRSAPSPRAVVALHLRVKHGSRAPTRRPAHVRAGEPGLSWSPDEWCTPGNPA